MIMSKHSFFFVVVILAGDFCIDNIGIHIHSMLYYQHLSELSVLSNGIDCHTTRQNTGMI